MKGFTGEQILEACTKYTWKKWKAINQMDRDEVIGAMVLGMTEAAGKIDDTKTAKEAESFQWSYALGYAKKFFALRSRLAKYEKVALDWDKGTDGKSDDSESLTMHEIVAGTDKPEGFSPEMKEALDSLSPEEREVIKARHIDGLSAEETLARLGIAARSDCSTARMTVSRLENAALAKLRTRLTVAA